MKVAFTRQFQKDQRKLSVSESRLLLSAISEAIAASSISNIGNCKPIAGVNNCFRIRIGDRRAFFHYDVRIENGVLTFLRIANRGEAYSKGAISSLKLYIRNI